MAIPDGNKYPPTNLIDVPTSIGGGFAPVGDAIHADGQRIMLLWLDMEFNNSTEVQLCILTKQTIDGVTYELPILNKGFEDVEVRPLVFKLADRDYERIPLPVEIGDLVPYAQIAMRAIGEDLPRAVLNRLDYSMRS